MNKKGFTEAQLILFVILFCIGLLVFVPFFNNVIKDYEKSNHEKKINRIIDASKNWLNSINNKELIDGKAYYISTSDLVKEDYLSKELLSGCVKIVYQESYSDYNYTYNASDCKSIMSGKDLILSSVIQSGDGLYHIENEYIYKGANPNNYIKINNNLYRIIKIDNKGIRIITNDILEEHSWDSAALRTTEKNSYCVDNLDGCNAYIANNTDVTQDSEINQYLESAYLNILSTKDTLLTKSTWNIGMLDETVSKENYMKEITSSTISSTVGLINVYEYQEVNINNKNWLDIGKNYWTITGVKNTNNMVWMVNNKGKIIKTKASEKGGVRPVLNIDFSNKLTGNGTFEDPYILK